MNDDPIERRKRQRESRERTRLTLAIVAVGVLLVAGMVAAVMAFKKKNEPEPEVTSQPFAPPIQLPPTNSMTPVYYLSYGLTTPYPEGAGLPFIQGGNFDYQFRENELKAISTYHGKRFMIAGPVADLSVDEKGTVLVIGQPNFSAAYCRCMSADPLLIKVKTAVAERASQVTVEGTCTRYNTFESCRVTVVR